MTKTHLQIQFYSRSTFRRKRHFLSVYFTLTIQADNSILLLQMIFQSESVQMTEFLSVPNHMCVNPQCEKQPQIDTNSLHDRSASHQLALFALCCIDTFEVWALPVIACAKRDAVLNFFFTRNRERGTFIARVNASA